jgi:competence protein ComEC
VPSHTAIDIVEKRGFYFIGDSVMNEEGFLKNFHIKPSRILHRVEAVQALNSIGLNNNFIYSNKKIVAIVNKPINHKLVKKIKVDAIVVTKNPKLYIHQLMEFFDCNTIIFDGSNANYKINYWTKDCDSLNIDYHVCATNGAYVLNL